MPLPSQIEVPESPEKKDKLEDSMTELLEEPVEEISMVRTRTNLLFW